MESTKQKNDDKYFFLDQYFVKTNFSKDLYNGIY